MRSDQFRETDAGRRYFTGNVKVQNDDLLLTSQSLEWLDEGPLQFEEGLELYHDRAAMAIDQATFDLESDDRSARLQDLSLVLFDFPVQATLDSLTANDARYEASGLSFSGCDPRFERWGFRIKRIRVNRESTWVTVRGVAFYVGKLPMLYLPFFAFKPPSETNGIATTKLSYRSDNGLIIEQPIRFFGRQSEMEIAPRYLLRNGPQLTAKVKATHLTTTVDWLPDDKRLNDQVEPTIGPSRWRVKVNHLRIWRGLETLIDFTQTSDFAYQHDFEFDSLTQPQFATSNTAALRYASRDWNFSVVSQRFDSTSEDALLGERFPELDLRWQPRWGGLSATTHFNGASYRNMHLKSHRRHLEQTLRLDLRRPWGAIAMGGEKAITRFTIDPGDVEQSVTRHLDAMWINAGLNFDKHLPDRRLTLAPRLYYGDRSFTDAPLAEPFDRSQTLVHATQLFGDSRVSGLDHIPGDHRLAVGFQYSAVPRTSTAPRIEAALAHVTHFDGPYGNGPETRGLAGTVRMHLHNGFAFEHRQSHDNDARQTNNFSTVLAFEPSDRKSVYASIGKRPHDDLHQREVGFRWPLSARWEALGAYGFDARTEKLVDAHVGLAFTGCCYRTTLFAQRAIDWDFVDGRYRIELENRFMIRVHLGGLGAIGPNRIESLVKRKRFGFR